MFLHLARTSLLLTENKQNFLRLAHILGSSELSITGYVGKEQNASGEFRESIPYLWGRNGWMKALLRRIA
jgi:hypothetical protein